MSRNTTPTEDTLLSRVAQELSLPPRGVRRVAELLDEGNTVPFIARYRKEATSDLDEVQIRAIEERRAYLLELENRRASIVAAIEAQGKLTPALKKALEDAPNKAALEDLYLPYKKKRRTRAATARERGLEPLAQQILAQPPTGSPSQQAARFVNPAKEVPDVASALAGARDIVAEVVAERADLRASLRQLFRQRAQIAVRPSRKAKTEGHSKYEAYYDFSEPARKLPSHRFLAIARGEQEGFLRVSLHVDDARPADVLRRHVRKNPQSPFASELDAALEDSYKRLLAPSMESEVRAEIKQRADTEAVEVFATNMRGLLMAGPLGAKAVVGIDPGLRTGCKCVAVDATGNFCGHVTIHLTRGEAAVGQATRALGQFLAQHRPQAVAVGNGTGGREAEKFVRELLADEGQADLPVVSVNEAGASVYSASDLAREEFPDLDLTLRGAISIARRLQDPLSELVKIEPKAIGVGQYQHDVHQPLLARKLHEVVERCVNEVGVELNTASAPLLAHVAGVGPKLAQSVVKWRAEHGAFVARSHLTKVPGLGPRTFEQCAGFLRLHGAKNPLDASAVHPERYDLVKRMASDLGVRVGELVGNPELATRLKWSQYEGDDIGELTLKDILTELAKPGRDPRARFEAPRFSANLHDLSDLREGMILEGVVTNVTAFGAFVDVGVHQDGLIHVSELADHFVRDPNEVVQVGDRVRVQVLSVDEKRKRISLRSANKSTPDRCPP